MRNYLFLMILAAFLIGCGNNTELRWENDYGPTVREIQWLNEKGVDQEWREDLPDQQKTSFKEVNVLTGQGECFDPTLGEAAEIVFPNGKQTAILSDGSSNELTISRTAKKKK